MPQDLFPSRPAIVIGGGPAGLAAAEVLLTAGGPVDLYDAMPSVGRKFLIAGRGGMNITHSEALPTFLQRYGARQPALQGMIEAFDPAALRQWCHDLGIDTFVGSSGRVFPTEMKAAPLLRAWLHRLREMGLRLHVRHRWLGWDAAGQHRFATPAGEITVAAPATILALGGGSWAKLGSDGAWVPLLQARGITVAALKPANCGFDLAWSKHFRERFAGHPLKAIAASAGAQTPRIGECMVTAHGIEGGLIYALSATLREQIAATGSATLTLDLLPAHEADRVVAEVARPRGTRSLSSHLQSRLGLKGVKAALLREVLSKAEMENSARLATTIKALPLTLNAARPLDEAISSAGGVPFEALDATLMLRQLPGVFCTGEMLDWEAPTGGYLLTACFATGRHAGEGALAWLRRSDNLPVGR